ncbi:hypothetical protein BD770DRAFT_400261 [Pilaira anomala]|nr:hypothetical protein BD770DRAFT_400261 [Pilaira anomala]
MHNSLCVHASSLKKFMHSTHYTYTLPSISQNKDRLFFFLVIFICSKNKSKRKLT